MSMNNVRDDMARPKKALLKGRLAMLAILAALAAASLSLVGCGGDGADSDPSHGTDPGNTNASAASGNYDLTYSDGDLDPSYAEADAAKISLEDNGIAIDGSGAQASGSTLSITEEGVYILTGTLSNGQIIIDTPDDEKIQLVMKNAQISSSDSAPLLIKESDKVFLTLAEGSSNSLTGPDAYSSEAAEDSIDGVLFSKADLCINGSGALTVTAAAEHGIVSKDDLIITGGKLTVTAAGDGLQGKDCVKIKDGTIAIDAASDGIQSSNAEDADRGFVSIDGGKFTIDAGYDGIQAETLLRVADGSLSVTSGGGSEYASTQEDWGANWGGGDMGGQQQPGGMMPGENPRQMPQQNDGADTSNSTEDADSSDDTASAKGLKAGRSILISGGNFDIDSSDDSLHSNGNLDFSDGTLTLSSGDDGIHADADLLIESGSLDIAKSYEGIEGNTITINGGNLNITASDDGLNAAGGSDGSSMDGRAGQNPFDVDESAFITINGGSLSITASGDGIDSNGTLDITDGLITVSCPTTGDTAVLDFAAEGTISGGTFIGTGAVQMAQTFDSSEQGVVSVSVSQQTAGTSIVLSDSNGTKLLAHEAGQSFAVVILSSPDIKSGETYTLNVGSVSGEVTAE